MSSQRRTDEPQRREWSQRETVHSPVLPAQTVRQGATGHNVRYVLGFGIVAAVIVLAAIWLVYFA
jgi:hypothetical protein